MESEGEIEYLDEDAEIVEQLVQAPFAEKASKETKVANTPLLVERRKSDRKRKRRKESDEDSDYDPSEDLEVPSPSSKKRKPTSRKSVTKSSVQLRSFKELPVKTYTKTETVKSVNRKKMDIRIPDYEDPLCLPVKAVRNISSDLNRLKHWNNACVEHFKHCDTLLKPEKGLTMSSSRTILLKNVVHKETGRTETTVWSKTCVTNGEGVKKSEIFQCLLPKYREKTVLRAFKLNPPKKKPIRHINEVILTKEEHKNGEVLIAYMPQEKTSAVYKFDEEDKLLSSDQPDDKAEPRRALREIASCKMCAPCFQCSWRGTTKSEKRKLQCPICARTTISMYNLLTHVRAHSPKDVRRHKTQLSAILAAADQKEKLVSEEIFNETDTKDSTLDQESTSTPSQQTVDEIPSISQREVRRSKRNSQHEPKPVSKRTQHDISEHQNVKIEISTPSQQTVDEIPSISQRELRRSKKISQHEPKPVSKRTKHNLTEHQNAKNEISTPSQQTVDEIPSISQREVRRSKRNSQHEPKPVSKRTQYDISEQQNAKNEISTLSQQTVDEIPSISQGEVRRNKRNSQHEPKPVSKRIQHNLTEHQNAKNEISTPSQQTVDEIPSISQGEVRRNKRNSQHEPKPVSKRTQHDLTKHQNAKNEISILSQQTVDEIPSISQQQERRSEIISQHEQKPVSKTRQHDLTEIQKAKNEMDNELKNIDRVSQHLLGDDDECSIYGKLVAMKLRTFSKDHRARLMDKFVQVVDYHYRCRICNEQAQSIKNLREHVLSHKGTTQFKCEVGNHMTT